MKQESLKLTGRVVSVNAADQSVLLESTESPNRLRVYTNDALFKKIDHILTGSWFNGGKTREMTGTFYIQGRVLMGFTVSSKPAVVHINDVYIETNEDCRSFFDFVRLITRAVHPGPSK